MSDRILKHSINKSESLSKCSLGANLLFDRLLLETDDHGCFDAREIIIKPLIFPLLMDKVQESDINKWLIELVNASCFQLWEEDDGKKYGMYLNFSKHNSLTNIHKAHTPCPPWLLDENGCDPRIPTKSKKAFEQIREAYMERGEDATYEEIAEEIEKETGRKTSYSTISKYKKQFPALGSSDGKDITESKYKKQSPTVVSNNGKDIIDNFETDWNQYPRKAGNKKKAQSCYLKSVNSPTKRKTFLAKMETYVASVNDPTYLQHGEKFFRNWESLVVPEKVIPPAKQTSGSGKLEQIKRLVKDGPSENNVMTKEVSSNKFLER